MSVIIFLGLIFLVCVFVPSFWVRAQLHKYSTPRDDFPGTGGELAVHLLARAGLHGVGVESIQDGLDHYDPVSRTVKLGESHYNGKSVSAIAVAAHEVGHALQHARHERMFDLRIALMRAVVPISRIAGVLLVLGPFVSILIKMPGLSFVFFALAIMALVFQLAVHLVTLPVEFDASFGKALPILTGGGYLSQEDIPAARSVLRAAAFSYVAGALAGVFNIFALLRLLR